VTIEEDVSIGASDDIIEESIMDDESMGASEDIMELSIDDESIGICEDIAEESIADDSIDDIDDDSIDEEASWAMTGSARTAATAVVASRVRIIVGSLGSTLAVGQPRGAVPGWVQAPRGSDDSNVVSRDLFRLFRVPEQIAARHGSTLRISC
jgi:hypothetical protein